MDTRQLKRYVLAKQQAHQDGEHKHYDPACIACVFRPQPVAIVRKVTA